VTLNADISASIHLTDEQLAACISDIVREIFELMVAMPTVKPLPSTAQIDASVCGVTGMLGFAGTYNGLISLHCPVELALGITSHMLGCDCNEVNDDLRDAIGEVANMLGGNVKRVLSKGGLDVRLSIPTVIFGGEHAVNVLSDPDCLVVAFDADGGVLLIGLTLKKE